MDRLGYKCTSVIGDIMSGATVMLVPLLYHTVGLAFWQLLALVFIRSNRLFLFLKHIEDIRTLPDPA